jgi:hypothetical protein
VAIGAPLVVATELCVIPSGFVILARLMPWGLGLAALALLLALIGEWSVAGWGRWGD